MRGERDTAVALCDDGGISTEIFDGGWLIRIARDTGVHSRQGREQPRPDQRSPRCAPLSADLPSVAGSEWASRLICDFAPQHGQLSTTPRQTPTAPRTSQQIPSAPAVTSSVSATAESAWAGGGLCAACLGRASHTGQRRLSLVADLQPTEHGLSLEATRLSRTEDAMVRQGPHPTRTTTEERPFACLRHARTDHASTRHRPMHSCSPSGGTRPLRRYKTVLWRS